MLLSKLDSVNSGYNAETKRMKGKTIGEFSDREWDKLLEKVDGAIDAYKEDLKKRQAEALEKKKEQVEELAVNQKKQENDVYEQSVVVDGILKNMRFQKINENMFSKEQSEGEKPDVTDSIEDVISDEVIQKIVGNRGKIPYSVLADENGIIEYHGVMFIGDTETNSICLGDMSDPNNVLSIQLSGGGYLKVNVDSIETLSKAITMFSPEDVNRIMRAIAQYNKTKQIQQQIEDETSGLQVLEKDEETI